MTHITQTTPSLKPRVLGAAGLALLAALAFACSAPRADDDDDGSGGAGAEGPVHDGGEPMASACELACQALDSCGLCLSIEGTCVAVAECPAACEDGAFDAECVNAAGSCQPEVLAGCFAGSSGAGGSPSSSSSSSGCTMVRYYLDSDGDGHGDPDNYIDSCDPTGSYNTTVAGDCCDSDPDAYPGQTEYFFQGASACGSYDYDCDGNETPQLTTCGEAPNGQWYWDFCPPPACGESGGKTMVTCGQQLCSIASAISFQACR